MTWTVDELAAMTKEQWLDYIDSQDPDEDDRRWRARKRFVTIQQKPEQPK